MGPSFVSPAVTNPACLVPHRVCKLRPVRRPRKYKPVHALAAARDEPVASRIARSFVDACVPGGKPYAEALADFCRNALDAYRNGYSLQALQFELSASNNSYTRKLRSDEVELRDVWLSLVYKTLRQVRFPVERTAVGVTDTYDKFDEFVQNIISAVRAGYDMKRIQLEQSLRQSSSDRPRTTLESAILNQSTRLVITTLSAADDEMGLSSSSTPKD